MPKSKKRKRNGKTVISTSHMRNNQTGHKTVSKDPQSSNESESLSRMNTYGMLWDSYMRQYGSHW